MSRIIDGRERADSQLAFFQFSGNTLVWNEAGEDRDVRFETDSVTSAFFVDGGNNRVVINEDGDDCDFRVEGDTQANLLVCDGGLDRVGIGVASPATMLEIAETKSMTATATDGYAACLTLDPDYSSSTVSTLTQHNYIDLNQPSVSGGTSKPVVSNACVFRFDAAAGTHKAVDGATTKSTPGAVKGWVKVNVNGTIYYVPAYTSKTS